MENKINILRKNKIAMLENDNNNRFKKKINNKKKNY
jgi:hypothetical protein